MSKILVKLEVDTDGDWSFTLPPCFVPSQVDTDLWLGAFENTVDAYDRTVKAIRTMMDTLSNDRAPEKELFAGFAQIIELHKDCPGDVEAAKEYWNTVADDIGPDHLQDLVQTFMSCASETTLFFNWESGNYECSVEFIPHKEEDVVATYRKYAHLYY